MDKEMSFNDENLVPDTEASVILNVAVQTVRNWRHKGAGPAYHKFGRAVRYRIRDLREYIRQNRVEPTN
ncbi:hypothetical protein DSCW_02530 [Desulfosarcina widdelii]|uniref:Helix-turn-helix domain-containing protein n=1 Tax=Desulfosarcina widdelii TaxID=947919 RepID=A0A5K7YU17_9BACT|nr:helix-turn-helix domain-containing protein [Desulfosarcina widdelii]BBO72836.1 hypothetical protein DSCW_02530 [Desulfosarcina widdelii]